MMQYRKRAGLFLLALLPFMAAFAGDQERGTVGRETSMYLSPDANSQRVATVTRGRDVPLIIERSTIGGKSWVHVLAVVDVAELQVKEVSGWLDARLLITNAMPNADQIIYAEAVDSQAQAPNPAGRQHAARDPKRPHYRLYPNLPTSPL